MNRDSPAGTAMRSPMWKNFSTAIGLLAIAMVAALYSSTATRDGRILPSAISALIGLGISVWVAWKLVPRLAAGVDWQWLPYFTHYQVTREGWLYFGAITIVVFASVNTANNFFYMILSALLAVLVLSGLLSELNLGLLKLSVRIPSHCFAREPFPVSIQVHNRKRVFPTFSLQIETADESAFHCSGFYVPLVQRQKCTSDTGQGMLTKRGRCAIRKLRVSSRYPFGFFVKDFGHAVEADCICYPEIIPQEHMTPPMLDVQGSRQRFAAGFAHDLSLTRDQAPSDTARHVHWKASAKTSVLKTREYAAEESSRVVLAFDRFGHPDEAEKFEQLVSYTASLAYYFVQNGVEVTLVADDWQSNQGNTPAVLDSILEYLALVQLSPSAERPAPLAAGGAMILTLRKA